MSADIKLLAMDCDGVLTDGGLFYFDNGMQARRFSVRDGAWLRIWHRQGFQSAIITGKESDAVEVRARHLEVDYLYQKAHYKGPVFQQLLADCSIPAEQIAFIGDDVIDLPVFQMAGLSIAVADAAPEVLEAADYVTKAKGGHGAVREVICYLLRQMNLYDEAMKRYLSPDTV